MIDMLHIIVNSVLLCISQYIRLSLTSSFADIYKLVTSLLIGPIVSVLD